MYFWNVNELAERLKNNTLSSYEEAQHYVAFFLISGFGLLGLQSLVVNIASLALFLSLLMGIFFVFLLNVLVLACGTIYCYKINKDGDNKDFIKRMVCLTFPISLRWAVFAIIILLVLFWPTHQLFRLIHPGSFNYKLQISAYYALGATVFETLFNACATTIYVVTYYWYMGKQMYKISH